MKPKRQYTAADIEVRERPAHTPKTYPLFVILGFLSEYVGRRIVKGGDQIERFYPHETDIANRFEQYLLVLKATHSPSATIERKVDNQGFIYFYSHDMTALIDSVYGTDLDYDETLTYEDTGKIFSYTTQFISHSIFKPITSASFKPEEFDDRFSYLLGAYHRYGRGPKLELANAPHKAGLIAQLLRQVDCPYVAWKTYQKGAPHKHEIEFEPSL